MIGVYKDLSIEEYHGHTESISRSGLMAFRKSPKHYWSEYLNPDRPPKEATEAMIFGNAFHTYILEPEQFKSRYFVKPEQQLLKDLIEMFGKEDGRLKFDSQKADLEDFMLKSRDKVLLSDKQMTTLQFMKQSLENHPQAWNTVEGGIYEQSYFWEDKESGILCKARPDILHSNMIIDLKTTVDASPSGFQRAIVSGGYHLQGAMQIDAIQECSGIKIDTFICLAIEKIYPFSIGVYILDEDAITKGRAEYLKLLVSLKSAREYNSYPGYETQTMGLPVWAL